MSEAMKTRTPKCARCRNHGYTVNLRGHKGFCPHKNCTCELCDLVKERQEVSKRQIKLRRQQQQEEIMGMYVPVPPSVFSQGSVCGINLDYLRVLFPRKRVDRLYAVLLQCNNDVNAATIKLQQEENSGETGESLNNLTTKNIPPVPVMKINKATQWPADSEQDNTETPTTSNTVTQHTRGRRQYPLNDADDSQHKVVSQSLFACSWPHAGPAQFTTTSSVSGLPYDTYGTLNRTQNADGIFSTEPFSLGRSVPLEGYASACNSDPVPLQTARQSQWPASKAGLAPTSRLPESCLIPQGPLNVPDVTYLDPGCGPPSSSQLLNMTPKISHWGGNPIYSSASTTWPDIPATIPMPRMAVPFILPPPLAPSWDPRTLPPLPFLPTSMPNIFHPPPYSQIPISLPVSSTAHLLHSPTFSLAEEAAVCPQKSGDLLPRPDHLILNPVERSESKAKDNSNMRQDDLKTSVLEVCSDSPDEFIDPTSFD